MSPANIEGALRVACPMLGGAAAIGNDRPYNVALFALDPDGLAAFAERHGLTAQAHEELARDPGRARRRRGGGAGCEREGVSGRADQAALGAAEHLGAVR